MNINSQIGVELSNSSRQLNSAWMHVTIDVSRLLAKYCPSALHESSGTAGNFDINFTGDLCNRDHWSWIVVQIVESRLSWAPLITSLLLAYLLLVRFLRYRRRDALLRTSRYKTRGDYGSMTLDDAHKLQLSLAEQEFPRTFSTSIFFALFKVRAVF